MTVCPDFRIAASEEDGFWTRSTTSAWRVHLDRRDDLRPGVRVGRSGIDEPAPAPASTRISSPAAVSLPSASGTRATRRSPGAVSLATPTFIRASPPGVVGSRRDPVSEDTDEG